MWRFQNPWRDGVSILERAYTCWQISGKALTLSGKSKWIQCIKLRKGNKSTHFIFKFYYSFASLMCSYVVKNICKTKWHFKPGFTLFDKNTKYNLLSLQKQMLFHKQLILYTQSSNTTFLFLNFIKFYLKLPNKNKTHPII